MTQTLEQVAAALPRRYPGPGGAIAVLKDGEVLLRHAWGYANAERRIAFTPRTLFRICSITKQFTCATVLAACGNPARLDRAIGARLPELELVPTARLLCHNQSGLRDYWAVAMLHGSPAEAAFGEAEAARVIAGTRTLHFAPGTRFSYVNQNFRLLSDALQDRTGQDLARLLRRHVLDPAGIETAFMAPDTRAMPDGTEGYEGTQASGFRPAVNNIIWTGDAGMAASLDDLVAWEKFIDAGRDDPESLPARLAAPVAFADGAAAAYGWGLGRGTAFGRAILGHGGGLRGWRSHRLYVPSERISVVVLFNHLSDASGAALDLLGAVLDAETAKPDASLPAPDWLGAYREPETGLAACLDLAAPGQLRLRFGPRPETLDLMPDGSATNGRTRLLRDASGLRMERPEENVASTLIPAEGTPAADIAGSWRCAELDAELHIEAAGGVLYGAFAGFLGMSRMEMLEPVGDDLWALPCARALDYAPPGDWTLAVRREEGKAVAIEIGCWLARRLSYERA
ncbi:D-aminopeptidase [Falsiroseomonas sp. HW251]|uniref:D-aminopeptidase n=1 Tax=Falsiroseomonas sp. HW251 TaxID=3390998 RepID=UPI003D315C32